jgi:hypothetical protein
MSHGLWGLKQPCDHRGYSSACSAGLYVPVLAIRVLRSWTLRSTEFYTTQCDTVQITVLATELAGLIAEQSQLWFWPWQ